MDFNKDLIPIVVACLAIFGSVLTFVLNERTKRRDEIYKRKEERYKILIESLKGFYSNNQDAAKKDAFISQVNLCWLYCPDVVVTKAYKFLKMLDVSRDRNYSDEEKETAIGDLILEIRKDLIHNEPIEETVLKASDFKHLASTKDEVKNQFSQKVVSCNFCFSKT
jgi:Pyruvate/2-oxoacid:ferredoxin oxidoreductase delta subunit